MTDLQKHILKMLKEIDGICKENNIQYYLAAGTALGAVRHHGFIPWDDDADIYMTHENWKKFYAIRQKLPRGRMLVASEEDFESGYTINRYADLTTMRLYRYLCATPQPAGIIIDILVLDSIPDRAEMIQEYITCLTEYADQLTTAACHANRCQYKTYFQKYWLMGKLVGRNKMLRHLKKRMLKHEGKGEGQVYIQRDPTVPHVWKEEVFGKPQYVPFEDTMLPIAQKPFLHLAGAFDEEWMYVPEKIERQKHIAGISLNFSNNNAFDNYLENADLRGIKKAYEEKQILVNSNGEFLKEFAKDQLVFISEYLKLLYLKKRKFDVEYLYLQLKRGNWGYLKKYFDDYLQIQSHKKLIGGCAVVNWLRSQDPVYIDLGDDFLYICLRTYMHYGNLGKANRILKAREHVAPSSEKTQELRLLLDTILIACDYLEQQKNESVLALIKPFYEKYPENQSVMRIYYVAQYRTVDSSNSERYRQFKDEISCKLTDDVLAAIYADMLWKEHYITRALCIYYDLAMNSHHGLILQHIRGRMMELLQEKSRPLVEFICARVRLSLGEEMEQFPENPMRFIYSDTQKKKPILKIKLYEEERPCLVWQKYVGASFYLLYKTDANSSVPHILALIRANQPLKLVDSLGAGDTVTYQLGCYCKGQVIVMSEPVNYVMPYKIESYSDNKIMKDKECMVPNLKTKEGGEKSDISSKETFRIASRVR